MSLLREAVAEFVDRVRRRPSDASDPAVLKDLSDAAKTSWDGAFAALHAPVAPDTWELSTLLNSADPQSSREAMRIPNPTEIVGICVSIVALTQPVGLLVPTADDIAVSIDLDNKTYLTSARGITTAALGRDGTFVSLGCIDVKVPRLFGVKLTNPSTELGVTFRWKRGINVYQNSLIALDLFTRPLF